MPPCHPLRPAAALLCATLMGATCGDRGAASDTTAAAAESPKTEIDICGLLTAAEIAEVTGTKVGAGKPQTYESTATCLFLAPNELTPTVSLVLTQGMPTVGSSAEMAEWRKSQGGWGGIEPTVSPVEGLGVPAIRNEIEGNPPLVAVECAAKGMLLDVTTSKLEFSKALAAKALARLT